MNNNLLYSNDSNREIGKHTDSYYYSSANGIIEYPVLESDIETDVCIVGAGYTGLSSALHLLKKGYKVTILDAQCVAWGASGRNGGQVGSGHNKSQEELEQMLGKHNAKMLWDLSEQAKQLVFDLIAEYDIDCDVKRGVLSVNHSAKFTAQTQSHVDFMRKHYQYTDIEFVDKSELSKMLATEAYHSGYLDKGGAHLHPLNFALGLAEQVIKLGGKIYEKTEVLSYQEIQNKISNSVVITTPNGTVKSKKIILACNGYLGELNNHIAGRVMPINNFILATEPLSDEIANALIRDNVAVADSKFVINYYRLSVDNRLLFGGKESYSYRFPSNLKNFVREAMLNIYPQLSNTKIDYAWGGTLGITMNRMPYFKCLSKNVISMSGYSGHGVAMATLSGKLLAEMLADENFSNYEYKDRGFELMQKAPNYPFPGGRYLQKPLLVLGMLYYSMRDKIG